MGHTQCCLVSRAIYVRQPQSSLPLRNEADRQCCARIAVQTHCPERQSMSKLSASLLPVDTSSPDTRNYGTIRALGAIACQRPSSRPLQLMRQPLRGRGKVCKSETRFALWALPRGCLHDRELRIYILVAFTAVVSCHFLLRSLHIVSSFNIRHGRLTRPHSSFPYLLKLPWV